MKQVLGQKWRRVWARAGAAMVGVSCLSCSPEEVTPGWHIGIYMAADNTLDGAASRDLLEMLAAKRNGAAEVTVFIDRAAKGAYARAHVPGIPDDGEARILELTSEGFAVVESLGEVDSLAPSTIRSFVERLAAKPEARKALIFWDHGSTGRFGSDETDASEAATLQVMAEALTSASGTPEHFDIIGFDTCLMGSYVALETFVPFADVYIASAEVEPGTGWDYAELLTGLTDPDATAHDVGELVVSTFSDYYASNPEAAGKVNVTLAAWDTSRVVLGTELGEALERLTVSDGKRAAEVFGEVTRAVAAATSYSADGSARPWAVDLGDVLNSLAESEPGSELAEASSGLLRRLLDARIAWGSGAQVSGALGLSASPQALDEVAGLFSSTIGDDSAGKRELSGEDTRAPEATLAWQSRSEGDVDFGIVLFELVDDVLLTEARLSLVAEDALGTRTVYSSFRVDAASGQVSLSPSLFGLPLAAMTLNASDAQSQVEDMAILLLDKGQLSVAIGLDSGGRSYTARLLLDDALKPQAVSFASDIDGTTAVLLWEELRAHPEILITPLLGEVAAGGHDLVLRPGRQRSISEVDFGLANLSAVSGLSILGTAIDVNGLSGEASVLVP